jgi:hypothetical protein
MALRTYADFNSGGAPGKGPCWALRYGPDRKPLDDVASELGLRPGMEVTSYYEDPGKEFEVTATLEKDSGAGGRWNALPDWSKFRASTGDYV